MSERAAIENWMLHAYADGELDAHERQDVERLLASDPAAAAEIAAWASQKAMLKSAFEGVLNEPVPASITMAMRRRKESWLRPALLAASLALVLIGGAVGWFAADRIAPRDSLSFVDQAIIAHEIYSPEIRHPVEVAASDQDHLVTWLSKRLGEPLKIPDLAAQGYTLLGGRLLTADDRPAAQLMYENAAKKRITVFLASNPGRKETALLVEQKDGITACYWLDGPLGFVVAGEDDRDTLMSLATSIYRQFES